MIEIREITKADDKVIENIIRNCLIEYGADHEGTAWADPDLCRFSEIYGSEGNKYWVAVVDGTVVGGVGIGRLTDSVCELQKMYCLREVRGTGVAQKLTNTALEYAARFYSQCYLETLPNMTAAQRFYEKHGFMLTTISPVDTGHYACDVKYIKNLAR